MVCQYLTEIATRRREDNDKHNSSVMNMCQAVFVIRLTSQTRTMVGLHADTTRETNPNGLSLRNHEAARQTMKVKTAQYQSAVITFTTLNKKRLRTANISERSFLKSGDLL